MGTLKEKFEELSAGIKASGKPAAAWFPKYTSTSLLNADNWWEALAVCEYALDTREDEKLTEGFFELIFSAFDCNVEVDLSEEEYEFWWEKVMRVCERVAVFSGAGWAQKGAQYSEARYGKRDMSYLFPCYEKAADMGWGEAEATVAYWRYMGFYCEQDKEEGERRFAALSSPEAILWGKHYRAFAEEFTGNKEKALQIRQDLLAELPEGDRLRAHVYAAMGDALDRGEGKIAEEAACYEKSLEIVPNLYSLKNLATLYFRYPELGKPKELAFEIWEKAWHAGVWSAANFLGYNYQEEEWLDLPKAIEWLEKGMLYCELYSAYELALIYLYNDDYKNVERGLMCLERCVEGDYIEGIEGLANVYFNGDLVEEDMSRAKQLLEKALELGSGNAAYRLGWMYERGFLSEEPDYVKAMEYYEKAAELDNVDGYCRAALYLANGYSGVTDAVKSREYYEKAAGMGSCFALVELSFLYENGNGVERSYEKAFELCEKAAQEGYPYAMFRVGLYLEKAVLGEAKPEEAFAWYTKAAMADENEGIFALGRCYKQGIGTEEDWDKALEWFGKGAEKNESRCLTELGLAYENGNGVEENPQKAVEYMTRAAEQDYGYA
ncbi:tetratricopeptide repeat protein, partial [Bacteroides caccae]